jgi:hypothetical protein
MENNTPDIIKRMAAMMALQNSETTSRDMIILGLIQALGGGINQPITIDGNQLEKAAEFMVDAALEENDNTMGVITKGGSDGKCHVVFFNTPRKESKAWFADKDNKETFPNIKPSIVL